MAEWKHRKKSKADDTRDPIEKAFFTTESVGSISTALIREGNQNVLDEVKEDVKAASGPAKVKITHSGMKYAVSPADSQELLHGLIPHLKSPGNGIMPSQLPDFSGPMPFLLYEDFNTNGLEGDSNECLYSAVRDKENGKKHNFYFFWRAWGLSGKTGSKMGSWGVGKSVFPAVSRINAFWGLTIRETDNEAFLMGQSVLKTHNRDDDWAPYGYFPYGYYGQFDQDEFAAPEDNSDELNRFTNLFRLKRVISKIKAERGSQTGVSVVMPFPREEVTLASLVMANVRQFFFPIVSGKLVVELQYEDELVILSKETLSNELKKIDLSGLPERDQVDKNQLIALFDFAYWIVSLADEKHLELVFDHAATAYEWRKGLFKNLDLTDLQKRFDRGERLAFKIPVKFQPSDSQAEFKYFKAYIQRDPELQEPQSIFIRDSLTITSLTSLKKKGVRGLVLIQDSKLINFFGQAEGPAHTGWHKDNFRDAFESIDQIISFVQRSLERLYGFLQVPAEGIDKTLLSDLFSIDLPDTDEDRGPATGKGTKTKKEFPELPPPKPKRYHLVSLKNPNGFKISGNPLSDEVPESLRIHLAYKNQDGKSKYSPFDFNVARMSVKPTGDASLGTYSDNLIVLVPTSQSYELVVTGFDKNRDLEIKIS